MHKSTRLPSPTLTVLFLSFFFRYQRADGLTNEMSSTAYPPRSLRWHSWSILSCVSRSLPFSSQQIATKIIAARSPSCGPHTHFSRLFIASILFDYLCVAAFRGKLHYRNSYRDWTLDQPWRHRAVYVAPCLWHVIQSDTKHFATSRDCHLFAIFLKFPTTFEFSRQRLGNWGISDP